MREIKIEIELSTLDLRDKALHHQNNLCLVFNFFLHYLSPLHKPNYRLLQVSPCRNHGLKPWFCAHGFYMFASYKILNMKRKCTISKALNSGFSGKVIRFLSQRYKVQALLAPLCMHPIVARLQSYFIYPIYNMLAYVCPLSHVHIAPSRFRSLYTNFTPLPRNFTTSIFLVCVYVCVCFHAIFVHYPCQGNHIHHHVLPIFQGFHHLIDKLVLFLSTL